MIKNIRFQASKSGEVAAVLTRPDDAQCLLVLAHGAGAGIYSAFMETLAGELARQKIAVFRYQFPYMEQHPGNAVAKAAENRFRRKAPDPQPVLKAAVVSAITRAHDLAQDLPLFAGGKSLGGRMTSLAPLPPEVRGLVFFGFPLHAPGRPSALRAEHLPAVALPMLFLQGTRDSLAALSLLKPVCEKLGDRATLHVVEGADHSFHPPKSSGLSAELVLKQLAETAAAWMKKTVSLMR